MSGFCVWENVASAICNQGVGRKENNSGKDPEVIARGQFKMGGTEKVERGSTESLWFASSMALASLRIL